MSSLPAHPSAGPTHLPRLPAALQSLGGLVPRAVPAVVVLALLNRAFADARRTGELDFLHGRCLSIRVTDIALELRLTLRDGQLRQAGPRQADDIRIEGVLYAYLLLIAQVEDPDTLFFRRQLKVEGDTELGLYVKNFLAAFEPGAELVQLQGILQRQIIALRGIQF